MPTHSRMRQLPSAQGLRAKRIISTAVMTVVLAVCSSLVAFLDATPAVADSVCGTSGKRLAAQKQHPRSS
jgi:hypothetical protein